MILFVAFALTFSLLFGWMPWSLALTITLIDWLVGYFICIFWIRTRVTTIPSYIPRVIYTDSPRSKPRLAA